MPNYYSILECHSDLLTQQQRGRALPCALLRAPSLASSQLCAAHACLLLLSAIPAIFACRSRPADTSHMSTRQMPLLFGIADNDEEARNLAEWRNIPVWGVSASFGSRNICSMWHSLWGGSAAAGLWPFHFTLPSPGTTTARLVWRGARDPEHPDGCASVDTSRVPKRVCWPPTQRSAAQRKMRICGAPLQGDVVLSDTHIFRRHLTASSQHLQLGFLRQPQTPLISAHDLYDEPRSQSS